MNLNEHGFVRAFELNRIAGEGDSLVVCMDLFAEEDDNRPIEDVMEDFVKDVTLGSEVTVKAGGNEYTGLIMGFVTDREWGFQARINLSEW